MENTQTKLDLAVYAGEILLSNGAEIDRVQQTVRHMLAGLGLQNNHVYVLANAIFATVEENGASAVAVRDIPLGNIHLGRVAAVNEVSRSLSNGKIYRLDELRTKLDACAALPTKPVWLQALACAVGSACFCFLIGGTWLDCIPPFVAGFLLQYLLEFLERRSTASYIVTVIGALAVSLVCWGMWRLGVGQSLNQMITGATLALVPGIALTTAIREFFQGDYLSGSIHLINALLKAACIAVGVVVALQLVNFAGGLL